MPRDFYFATEVARLYGIAPRVISDYFYQGRLDSSRCPVISGNRRLIPRDYLPTVVETLREHGKLPEPEAVGA